MAGISEKEFYNSHKILLLFKEVGNYRIYKTDIFDELLGIKVYQYFFKFNETSFRISYKQFEQLKEYGVKEIII